MSEFLLRLLEVKTETFWIIVTFSTIAALLMRDLFGSILISFIIAPIYAFASLLVLFLFRNNYLVVLSDTSREATIAAALGITLVFLMFLFILDCIRGVSSWRVKRMMQTRNLIGARSDAK